MTKKTLILGLISALALFIFQAGAQEHATLSPMTGEPPHSKIFTDIDVGSNYFVQLSFLKEKGFVEGYEDGSFRPKNPINRAEAVQAAVKILFDFETSKTRQEKTEITFDDISKNHWARESISKLSMHKIIRGYGKTQKTFNPEKQINLAEAVKIIMEIEKLKNRDLAVPTESKSSFRDVSGTEWFAPYLELAKKRTILTYTTKMLIHPEKILTRGEFIDLLYRTLKTREEGLFFGRATFYSDSFEGRGTSNDEKYTQNGYTAAHKTLPFNTKIKVTYLRNGQSVIVRINDRGPFTPSIDLDLTSKAFAEMANPSEGIIPIEYGIIDQDE
jgi:rare lipoprotein A